MKKHTRDLLLLSKGNLSSQHAVEKEIHYLNLLLQSIEESQALYTSFELIDLNRFKLLHDRLSLSKALKPRGLKPFQFLVNRN